MLRKVLVLMLVTALLTLVACSSDQPASKEADKKRRLVVVDYGGFPSEVAKKTLYDPFAEKFNVEVTVISPSDPGKFKAMVESGNVEWDVVEFDTEVAIRIANEGLTEKLDYSVIDKTDIFPEMVGDSHIGWFTYLTNIAYNTEVYPNGTHPKNWVEFFDTEKFPGPRAFYKNPPAALEAALIADGVKPSELYPLDVDRAFKSLDKIKDDIKVWWDSGALSTQLLATKEVHVSAAWNGRVVLAKDEGAKIDNEYNQAMIMSTSFVIPKGSKNVDLAQQFIAFAMEVEQQVAFSENIDYAPSNKKAVEMLSDELRERLGATLEATEKQFFLNNEYWAENLDEINERFNAWLIE